MTASRLHFFVLLWTLVSAASGQSLSLNEYLSAPSGGSAEFIELLWSGAHAIDSADILIRDSRPIWRHVTESILISPGELILLAQNPEDFSDISLAGVHVLALSTWPTLNNGGDALVLSLNQVLVDSTSYSSKDVRPGISRERIGGSTDWGFSTDPTGSTPGRLNSLSAAGEDWPAVPRANELLITEIMFDPLADPDDHIPDQIEFIEILNRSNRPVNLRLLWLSSLPDERGHVDSLSLTPANIVLQPDSIALAFRFGTSTEGAWPGSALLDPWPGAQLDNAVLLPTSSSLGLSNQGEFILIKNENGEVVCEAWFYPDLHHPVVGKGKGVSLERVGSGMAPDINDVFASSSSDEGATPGYFSGLRPNQSPVSSVSLSITPASFYPEHRELSFQTTITLRVPNRSAAHVAALDVYDENGIHRRTLTPGRLLSESMTVIWNGRDDLGNLVPTGFYVILARIMTANGKRIQRLKQVVSVIR